jgi:nanoRNase/pAp phosphatase (c-di-AMP/oligoRNAs hydrolase)
VTLIGAFAGSVSFYEDQTALWQKSRRSSARAAVRRDEPRAPDGDALGCTLAMALCLRQLGKDVTSGTRTGCWISFATCRLDCVVKPPASRRISKSRFALDTAVWDRVGSCREAVGNAGTWINIDHHVTNDHYGDLATSIRAAPGDRPDLL